MAVLSGTGLGNGQIFSVFGSSFLFTGGGDTGFTASNSNGTVVVTGTGLTYSSTTVNGQTVYQLTGGTITGVSYTKGSSNQTWSNIGVSAAAAFNAILDFNAFNTLFFGGNDIFNWSSAHSSAERGILYGFGGDDVFNVTGWESDFSYSIDGGTGSDTLNIAGGALGNYILFSSAIDLFQIPKLSNFAVKNVETINLAAGSNYIIVSPSDIVASGSTLRIDGSALGPSNIFVFNTNTYSSSVLAGNLELIGGAGDDIFSGGTGSNLFNGGAGNDTVVLTGGVTANLSLEGPQNLGTGRGTATFISIENLMGSSGDDTLTGDANDNILWSKRGSDTLSGGGGNDTFVVLSWLGQIYHTTVNGGTGTDTVVLDKTRSNYTLSVSGGTVTLKDKSDHFGLSDIALTNVEYAQFTDQTLPMFGPVLTTVRTGAVRNQTIAVSDLFSVYDVLGLPITRYQLWDATRDPLSGHFEINGVAQAAGTVIDITAAQLAQTTFVTGMASDNLQIRAFDGTYWSAADNDAWAPFTVAVYDDQPRMLTSNVTRAHLHSYALSSLFSAIDYDGDAMTQYQLWDSTPDPSSGHFEINGVTQAARTVITISASQLPLTTFVTGTVSDALQIRAFDGVLWSDADTAPWAPFTISIPSNNPPNLSTATQRAGAGQSLTLTSLFSVSDGDGDTMTRYQLWDSTAGPNSGHWVVNGQAQAAGTVIDITAAQLNLTSFVTGTVNDNLQIRAFDGISWSAADNAAWAPFTIGPLVNNAPAVQTSNQNIARGVTTALSSLITVSDPDSDPITKYQLWDGGRDPNSGHFEINGVAQAAGTIIEITAAQLGQTTFVTGILGDSLQTRAYDGISWSAADTAPWSPFTVSVPDAVPVVTTGNVSKAHFQSYTLSSLFSVSDSDGDSMTRYQLWDGTRDPNSGHFEINGAAQSAGTVIDITAAQLAQTTFVTGTVNDNLQIRTFDGIIWSAADTASWSPFTVSVPAYTTPHVTTGPVNAAIGQSLSLSSLITVTDVDGDSMTKYQLWDSTRSSLSGNWVVGGVTQAPGTVVEITAAQVASTAFVTGRVNDRLEIRA
ncbi:MAG TPA: hypothetical protein VJS47_00275, partial [Rhizomicrobium sp.]|nr:hypothetical protein [Rhizomicrobium sp.]